MSLENLGAAASITLGARGTRCVCDDENAECGACAFVRKMERWYVSKHVSVILYLRVITGPREVQRCSISPSVACFCTEFPFGKTIQ